ncbi:linear amide C-N hydrolase [Streptomyces sp. NBC_00304]|uniref:linear amide C-N hydrolase n=1 Tax=Streptomyces sp. NBC_00304 TaxID=2975706 RepID=UPI002E2D03B6|nr:linear amide C-N hydrolase [Streptomyces sp. NBC_00304]
MCTRALWADAGGAVLAGRNMDWMEEMATNLWAFPRGMAREDGLDGTLTWASAYGSVVAAAHDLMTVDGVNEAGLAAHQLFLPESDYGERDESRPALSVAVWMQYVLDNFATVSDAVAWIESSQLQVVAQTDPSSGKPVTLHMALDDRTGDSAVVEYLDGTPRVHHDRAYTVVTNSPPFEEQLARLRTVEGLGGAEPLPGGTDPSDRFARAAYYLSRLPQPGSTTEAVASLLSVMRNAAQPFRVADPDKPYASQTIWRTLVDLTNGIYVYESTSRPNIVWVRMSGLDLSEGAPALKLDLAGDTGLEGGLVGDVTGSFTQAPAMSFLPAR